MVTSLREVLAEFSELNTDDPLPDEDCFSNHPNRGRLAIEQQVSGVSRRDPGYINRIDRAMRGQLLAEVADIAGVDRSFTSLLVRTEKDINYGLGEEYVSIIWTLDYELQPLHQQYMNATSLSPVGRIDEYRFITRSYETGRAGA